MKITLIILIIGGITMFSGCSDNMQYYSETKPKADIKKFFNGNIKAWGIIQNWHGRVTSRFDVDMVGSWQGDIGILEENFRYYNGKTQKRVWNISKNKDGTYEGKASDIVGKASGKIKGSAVKWNYIMDITVDGSTYRLKLNDWMWQMNDGIMINRSYLKKFGITVAELTLFMQKQN